MRCNTILAAALVLLTAGGAFAQEWATKMFKERSHDFGTVARGAKSEFRFELTNLYKEDIHISSVRTSCGCTTPTIEKETLKTWEKGAIVAHFNTKSFTGQKNATVTVTIDKPYYAEVQLQVQGFIRSDIVFDPGEVNFGEIDPEKPMQQLVKVTFAGRSDWEIVDVRSANAKFEVELSDAERNGGQVNYNMLVRLLPGSPAGYLRDQLTIVTNDSSSKNIPLTVEGNVSSLLTLSPSSLFLGVLEPGQKVTKQLVVRSKKPFKVMDVKCGDDCFQFTNSDQSKTLHIIPITYTAGDAPGEVSQEIQIVTDVATASCQATATIKATSAE
ncbi:MAG: DUF1573 domain-containing protein [Pirellulaceae bacterium]